MKKLLNAYEVGKTQFRHAGFRVQKIVGTFNKPMEPIGTIHDTAEAALKALDKLGSGYAVFRIVQSKNGEEPREPISRNDLPVSIVSSVGPR